MKKGLIVVSLALVLVLSLSVFVSAYENEQCINYGSEDGIKTIYACASGQWVEDSLQISELTQEDVIFNTFSPLEELVSPKLSEGEEYVVEIFNQDAKFFKISVGEIEEEDGSFFILISTELKEGEVPVEISKGCVLSDSDPEDSMDVYLCSENQILGEEIKILELTRKGVVIQTLGNLESSTSLKLFEGDEYLVKRIDDEIPAKIFIGEIEEEKGIWYVLIGIDILKDFEVTDSEKTEEEIACENGCFLEDKCYLYGYRKNGKYCSDILDNFVGQKEDPSSCENNFECKSNLCIDSQCVEAGFFKRIMNWFKRIF